MKLRELEAAIDGLIKKNAINNYELGKRSPGVVEALAIAKATGDSAAHLLCVAEEDELKKQELNLLRDFRTLNEKDRNAYARRIATMAIINRDPLPDEKLPPAWKAPKPSAPKPKQSPASRKK